MDAVLLNPNRIAEAMRTRKMTPDDLAYEIRRLSQGTVRTTARNVQDWVRGKHEPRASVLPLIAIATGKTLDYFFANGEDALVHEDEEPG